MSGSLELQLLGQLEISADGQSLLAQLSAKSAAILCLLICTEEKKLTRAKLSSMLWGDSFETASYNLRYNLWNIRKVIPRDRNGQELILSDKEFCWRNPAYSVYCDLLEVRRLKEQAKRQAALSERIELLKKLRALLSGEFMEQFYIRSSDEFNEWVLFERAACQRLTLQVLHGLYTCCLKAEDAQTAAEALAAELAENPYDEELHFQMMELYLQMGQRPLAIRQYQECEAVLRRELNIMPQKKLRQLYVKLQEEAEPSDAQAKQHRKEGSRAHAVFVDLARQPLPEIPYLAVSEFLNGVAAGCGKEVLAGVSPVYLRDLSLLQPSLLQLSLCAGERAANAEWTEAGKTSPEQWFANEAPTERECGRLCCNSQILNVRLLQSLRHALAQLAKRCEISVRLPEGKAIDKESALWFSYLQECGALCVVCGAESSS